MMSKCEGGDSNARTPARLGPEPSAFDQARQPSRPDHFSFRGNKYTSFTIQKQIGVGFRIPLRDLREAPDRCGEGAGRRQHSAESYRVSQACGL